MSEGHDILKAFVDEWKRSFDPPKPDRRGIPTGLWSMYLKEWLEESFGWIVYECQFPSWKGKQKKEQGIRLDVAVWMDKKKPVELMDLAIEYELGRKWGDKYNEKFASGDFLKVLSAPAKAGLAIVGTPPAGKRENTKKSRKEQAEKILEGIKKSYAKNKEDDRPVGVIEVCEVGAEDGYRKYECSFHDLIRNNREILKVLKYKK